MKKAGIIIVIFIIIILILPFITVKGWRTPFKELLSNLGEAETVNALPKGTDNSYANKKVKVLISSTGAVEEIKLYDYLCGVIAGEMPAAYNEEALKAQSVAAFTYMVYRMEGEKSHPGLIPEHKGAYVCTDYTHCKAYLSKDEAIAKYGQEWCDKYWSKIEKAVSSTLKKVIVYDSKPINAVFHSMSSGKTESAKDVWGADIPYLVNVDSSMDTKSSAFESKVNVSETDFSSAITKENSSCNLTKAAAEWIGEIQRTEAGGVKTIQIGGVSFKGEDIRRIFSLRSTNFEVAFKDGNFTFTVKGYGHGVGMSQFGANELALEGKKYDEILKYYYTGTTIVDYEWED